MQMLSSRLFLSGRKLHFHRKGFPRPIARFSSSSPNVKNESVQTHPEVLPKITEVQNEVGGSFYLLKVFTKLKERVFSNPRNEKTQKSESLDFREDTTYETTPEVMKTGERLDAFELDKFSSRTLITVDSTSSDVSKTDERHHDVAVNELKFRLEPLDDVPLVDQGNGYQQYEVDQGTIMYRGRDQENTTNSPSHLQLESVGDGGKTIRTSDIAGSTEEALIEDEGVPPDKKFVTHLASNGSSDFFSTSGNSKNVLGSADVLDDDASTVEQSSGYSMETPKDGSNTMQIKSLISQVKKLPKDASQASYDDLVISKKIYFLKDGRFESRAVVTDETLRHSDPSKEKNSLAESFIRDKCKKQGQQKSRMEKPKERSKSETILQQKGKNTLIKFVENDDCSNMNFLDSTKKVPFEIVEHEDGSNSVDAASGYRKPKPSPEISIQSKKEAAKRDPSPLLFTEKGKEQTGVLVRFVPKSRSVTEIKSDFADCGAIGEIRFINSSDEKIFKDAHVRFKTKEGMRKALAKTDVMLGTTHVVVEPASSPSTYTSNRILAPDPIGVPGVPRSLVKNPTRTVMVKGLADNIASCHIGDAFGARVTGFFMGSSSSVGYIEFETEEAKEKAIAAFSIPVSGSQVTILRIDSPITTVVRISNVRPEIKGNTEICKSYGDVNTVMVRGAEVIDVHYKLSEWPAMVNILNSLNGQVVKDMRWVAQPAPVIPAEILTYLWSRPDGRRQVYSVFQNICQKLEESSIAEVKDAAAKYYEESIELFQR